VRIDFGVERDEDEPTPEELRQQIQDLIDVIQTTIEPDTWAINGGPGVIRAFRNTLVIRNSQFVHQQIAASGILP